MKKRALLIFLVYLNNSEARAYNLPSIAEVEVVHPLDNDGEGFVHIRLKWDDDPGFVEGQAFEIGLIVDPKYFAIPKGGNDKLPFGGYIFTRDGNDLSCDYRDVLNYSNASSIGEAILLIYNYCGEEALEDINFHVLEVLTNVADSDANFTVGTYCPEVDIVKGAIYDIFYYLWPSPQSLVLHSSDADEGFGWIVAEIINDTCDGIVDCPYVYGNAPWYAAIFDPGLAECDSESEVWHNRICVPTDMISFTPMEVGEGQGFGTECVDDDEDGIFAVQAFPMFGTNVGDCDDRSGIGYDFSNDGYDQNLGACFPFLNSPANGENLPLGEDFVFSWTPGGPYRHTLRIRQDLPGIPLGPLVVNQKLYIDVTGYEVQGSDLSVPGNYHWTVCYPHGQCHDDACCAEVRTFTVESRKIPECSPEIEEVIPQYACPGDDFEFNLFGSCLKRDIETDQIRVHIDDVELTNVNLIGDSFVEASAHVWDGAMPGPRVVIYANSDSEVTVADGLFEILGSEECEETPPSCPPCPDTDYGEWSACGGFANTCDETGTRQRMATHYECMAEAGVCFSYSVSETEPCSRDTDGLSCGASGATCVNGECVGCVPLTCGQIAVYCGNWDDNCGGTLDCGTCSSGETCQGGLCVTICTPNCSGKECGDDGCGGSCGTCTGCASECVGGFCQAISQASYDCYNDDVWWQDSCGQWESVKEDCLPGQECQSGQCVTICTPDCAGKECGGDGCGGQCPPGCSGTDVCDNGQCVPGSTTCTETQYWDPTSMSTTETVSSITLRVEFEANSGNSGIRIRVCKPGGSLSNPLHVIFTEKATPYPDLVMFYGALAVLQTGDECTEWGNLELTDQFGEAELLGGQIRVISPSSCHSQWDFDCDPPPDPGCGTCWFFLGSGGTMTRTCKGF